MYKCLIYTSVESVPFQREDLEDLLAKCRSTNEINGITGMLLYYDGCFIQVLEGEEKSVDETYRRIEADPRHRCVSTIITLNNPERFFSEWNMGFKIMGTKELDQKIPGFTNYLKTGHISESQKLELPRKITAFLDAFKSVARV